MCVCIHKSLVESVIREIKEETGLTIKHPQLVGMKHWYTKDDERYLVFLYRTSEFEGNLRSSDEGEVKWVSRQELPQLPLAYDMLNLLRVFFVYYCKKESVCLVYYLTEPPVMPST